VSGAATLASTHLPAAPLPLRVDALQADNLVDPMQLHSRQVRLSWQLKSDRRNCAQRAYRIGVASTRERAESGRYDLWDSGQVTSAQCFDISYAGAPLTSRARCFWIVEVWDDQGARARSAVAKWEMGLLDPVDWIGPWIGAETEAMRADRLAGFHYLSGSAHNDAPDGGRSFRMPIDLPEPADLTIYLVGSRQPEAMLDGKPLSLPPRDPVAFGPPPPYLVRASLPRGRHVLAMHVPANPHASVDKPRCAMLARADLASHNVVHFPGDKALTIAGKPASWADAVVDDQGWEAAHASSAAPFPGRGAFLMRRQFQTNGAIRSARLYMTTLGAYVPMLNGERVGEEQMSPEWTDFRKDVFYRAYDVTDRVKPGDNVLGAIVGDGWYGSYMAPAGRFGFGDAPLRLRAQLELEFADGSREVIASDEKWAVSPAGIVASDIYDGEDVDARLDQPGWARTDFTLDSRWEPARAVATPSIRMLGAALPPIRPTRLLKPVAITHGPGGAAVVDFGQNFAGWARLRVKGETGQRLTLRFAELLGKDGGVDQSNLRAARATDTYVLRGDPQGEQFEPRFTYHGFRYVQIDGLSDSLTPDAIDGVVVRSDLEETGELTLSQHVPQQLWQNTLWSQRSNFFGTPTDCPQRDERLGWMGDAHVFWDAACFNMDTAAFARKFMLTVREDQREDGSFPDFAPNNDLEHFTPPGSSPGWADAGVFIPWTNWQRYGDTSLIDQHWHAMERFLASIQAANPDHLWVNERGNDFGDWLSLDGKNAGDATTPKDLIGTAMWKGCAEAMVDMAGATRRSDGVKAYRALSRTITDAFNRAYVKNDGSVGNGSQTGYILALHFDLLPQALRQRSADLLVADIVRRGKLLSTGFLGTPYSLDVLADAGHHALVYDLLLRTAYPSWGYMIAHNATTIWERWNGDVGNREMNSYNHYALGAVSGFMFRRIAGISPTAPGFARFRFDPVCDPRMPRAGGRYDSHSGPITTRWDRQPGAFALNISIPANSRCAVCLPATSLTQIREGGQPITAKQFDLLPEGKRIVLDMGSGDYAFTVAGPDYA